MQVAEHDNRKIRWGVLGAARINRRMIPGLKAASNAHLVGLASRNLEKGREAALQYGIPTTYPTYQALLDDPDIEAVYLPLPNSLHLEWVVRAVRAGKHVLCEKPLALSVDEVAQIEQAGRQAGVNIMEAYAYRFHPQQARAREMLQAGAIGELRVLRGTFAFVIAPGYNIRLEAALGGGATWDVGCYGVDVARWMFGREPQAVYAEAVLSSGVEQSAAAVLDFGVGCRAVLDYSFEYGRRSFYELMGPRGTLSVENMWQEADVPAYLYHRNDKGLTTQEFAPMSHFRLEAEAFGQAILDRQPAPLSLAESAANTRVCLALLQSIREGRKVTL